MYYPKSQVKTNMYTNGNEFYLINTQILYTGYYYETSSGKKYTGRNPSNGEGTLLTPYVQLNETTQNYEGESPQILQSSYVNNYNNEPVNPRSLPTPYISSPTESERQIGEYRRYFAKKTNELIYIEISKDTYNKFTNQDPNVAMDLYEVIFIPFSLTSTGININLAAIIERRDKWYGFSDFIQSLS
jgi:hypothetical protein